MILTWYIAMVAVSITSLAIAWNLNWLLGITFWIVMTLLLMVMRPNSI